MKHRRTLKLTLIILMMLFVLPLLLCAASHFVAQYVLWQHAQPLFDYPLPPQTELLERNTDFVDGGGSSDCIGHIWIVVATQLTERELNDYYHTDAAYDEIGLPPVGATIEGRLSDGRWRAIIDSYGAIDGRDYSLLCGW